MRLKRERRAIPLLELFAALIEFAIIAERGGRTDPVIELRAASTAAASFRAF
jgi:hypothetical protein